MLRTVKYTKEYSKQWDEFVLNQSVNGTFLQTMNFLCYHPDDRFIDESILIFDDNTLVAVVPACRIKEDNKDCFFSHKGSSYGGIIVSSNYYKSRKIIDIINHLDNYIGTFFDKAILKITPDLFCKEQSDLLQYGLQYYGFMHYEELSTYVDLSNLPNDVRKGFDRNKNRNINKCIERELRFQELNSTNEIERFHELLTINLSKYNITPIHTVPELIDLKNNREQEHIQFFGVYSANDIVAAGMMFDFDGVVYHAQNLSYDYHIKDYSPITFLYYKVIEFAKNHGYKYLSWGISTENHGKVLNFGLIRNKESYGSKYQVNRTYYKQYY